LVVTRVVKDGVAAIRTIDDMVGGIPNVDTQWSDHAKYYITVFVLLRGQTPIPRNTISQF